jgi:hypothetical protein
LGAVSGLCAESAILSQICFVVIAEMMPVHAQPEAYEFLVDLTSYCIQVPCCYRISLNPVLWLTIAMHYATALHKIVQWSLNLWIVGPG